jgi:hypothetical protein
MFRKPCIGDSLVAMRINLDVFASRIAKNCPESSRQTVRNEPEISWLELDAVERNIMPKFEELPFFPSGTMLSSHIIDFNTYSHFLNIL